MYLFPLFHPLPWPLENCPVTVFFWKKKHRDKPQGGDEIAYNLVFSTCRESGDHGPFNSWDRQPFLTTVRTGEPSMLLGGRLEKLRDLLNIPSNNRGERWDLKGFCNDLWLPQERDGNFIGFMWNQCVRLLVLEDRNVEAISIVVCFCGAMAYRHTSCSFSQTMNAFWTPLFDFAPFMVEYPNGCTSFEDELAY